MTTDLENMIEEEFANCRDNVEVAKLYADIQIKLHKQLEFFLNNDVEEDNA